MDTEQMKGEIRFANADKDSNYTKGSNQTKSDPETAKLGPAIQLDDPNMAKGGEKELQAGKVHDKNSAELTNRLKRADEEQSRRAYETFDTKPVREIQDELQGKGQKQESS